MGPAKAPDHEENWKVWKLLNRLHMGTARSRDTLNNRGYLETSAYREYGDLQTSTQIYTSPLFPTQCPFEDLITVL